MHYQLNIGRQIIVRYLLQAIFYLPHPCGRPFIICTSAILGGRPCMSFIFRYLRRSDLAKLDDKSHIKKTAQKSGFLFPALEGGIKQYALISQQVP